MKKIDISKIKTASSERELERLLREAGCFSRTACKYIAGMCKPNLREAAKENTKLSTLQLIREAMQGLILKG